MYLIISHQAKNKLEDIMNKYYIILVYYRLHGFMYNYICVTSLARIANYLNNAYSMFGIRYRPPQTHRPHSSVYRRSKEGKKVCHHICDLIFDMLADSANKLKHLMVFKWSTAIRFNVALDLHGGW